MQNVGFWRNPGVAEDSLPVPVEGATDNSATIAAMRSVESYVRRKYPKSMGSEECRATGEGWIAYRGLSTCRICRENNGFKEFYAAGFCWPEGLAHYLDVHHLDIVASTPLAEFAGAMQALASTLPPPPPASSVSKKQPAKHLTTDPKKAAASKTSSRT